MDMPPGAPLILWRRRNLIIGAFTTWKAMCGSGVKITSAVVVVGTVLSVVTIAANGMRQATEAMTWAFVSVAQPNDLILAIISAT